MNYSFLMGLGRFTVVLLLVCFGRGFAGERLKIVATFLPAYCFTVNITGETADVQNLTSGGGDLHDFQLTPAEMRKISSADIIVMNGLGLETWVNKALRGALKKGASVVRLSDGLGEELIPLTPNGSEKNPHIWLDPMLAAHAVSNILSVLERADPANAASYAANARKYVQQVEDLVKKIDPLLEPVRSTAFITYHNAFPYFARRFQLKIPAVVEQTPEIAPTPKERAELVRIIKRTQAKALFSEPAGNNRLAGEIASDTGIRLGELDPIEMGPPGPKAYEEAMLKNAQKLVELLK
jgi:zinc transport system substrate-binding protein